MFKVITNSLMKDNQFGVGSTIGGDSKIMWLVIRDYEKTEYVRLLNLYSMVPCTKVVRVTDVNHLREEEARELTSTTGLNWAFSDYSLHPEGFKRYD